MEKIARLRCSPLLFLLFFCLAVYGFFRTYFGLIPDFDNRVSVLTHLHGISVTVWMLLLVIQPLLVQLRWYKWHRLIGKGSYLYVPFLGLIMLLVIRQGYAKGTGHLLQADLLAFQFVPVSAFLCFAFTYTFAMMRRTNRYAHRSWMIVHALGLLWAAFGRLDYSWTGIHTFEQHIAVSYLPSALILVLLLMAERLQTGKINRVYLMALSIFLATPCFYYYCTKGPLWQTPARLLFQS